MIEIERHIEILLLSNDCVIVPGLGGFMAHHVDARYDESDGMFIPPIRTLGFNPQLQLNDSLLVQSYIEAHDISYPEALRRVEDEVAELRAHLDATGSYELNGIGVLRLNEEGNMEFEPCEAGILTPSLYGFGSFAMKPLQPAAAKTVKAERLEADSVPDEKPITIKMAWLRNAVAVAAAVLAFLMIGTPVKNSDPMSDMQQSAFINVSTHHRPSATHADALAAPAEGDDALETVAELSTTGSLGTTTPSSTFGIVMACQVSEKNAQAFISQLSEKGFTDARIVVSGGNHIRRVVYGSYESEDEAAATLRQLRSESRLFKDTWIMELK